ncbi:amino acid ABC transporter permease [Deinococcus roseus]|uniref:Glutamine ABC transporter permease n=1 Tax=Deinococcus roseus TaxID=392414 RepID=A0ABQ2CW28_9DEIO|nr:amino acid ABC transporter permease [Deinococcus roseus]GGJ26245.1 glutamine ABC transporter permease [Deinococcus roseus]
MALSEVLEGFRSVFEGDRPALLLTATVMTLKVSLSALGVGLVFGLLIAVSELWRLPVLSQLGRLYVTFVRGIPLIVQLGVVYYGLPTLGIFLDAFPAAVLALGLYSAAYVSEIIRGGLQSIPRGQIEASRSLGLSNLQTLQSIILPQAMMFILPALGNEFISLILGSSLASAVTITELFRQGSLIIGATYRQFETYAVLAVVYFVLTFLLTRILNFLEQKYTRGVLAENQDRRVI